jgi:hypothetical protein
LKLDGEITTMEQKRDGNLFGLLLLASLGVLVVLAFVLAWPGVSIKVDVNTVPTVLAPLMLTAAFIERAVEVMISPWRDPGSDQKVQALKAATNNSAAIASQQAAADDYTQYKGKTRRYAFAFALLLGTAAAMVGVRALWPFLDDPSKNPPRTAFIVVDVVLSALLLAGGANGIHSVVIMFTSFFDNNSQKNQGLLG